MKTFYLLCMILLLASCQKSDTQNIDPYHQDELLYNSSFSNEINDSFKFKSKEKDNHKDFERFYTETSEIEKIKLNYFDFIKVKNISKIKWIVLYSKQKISKSRNILLAKYNALSVIFIDSNNQIKHQLYKKNSQKEFIIDTKYNTSANSVLFPATLRQIATSINKKNKSFLAITNASLDLNTFIKETTKTKKHKKNSILREDYSKISENNLFSINLDYQSSINYLYSDCNPLNCSGPPEIGCKISGDPGGGLECRGDITDLCFQERINQRIMVEEPSLIPLNIDRSRKFRDNTLKNSIKGKKYIETYYKLNYIFQGLDFSQKVNLISQYKSALKLYSLIDRVEKINSNEILINNSDKEFYINELNKLSKLSINKEFSGIITNLKRDVINYTNKRKSEILLDFQ